MNLVQRVQDILLRPANTWPAIAAEPDDVPGLYKNYVAILALIPAICGFIGMSVIGVGAFGTHMRVPIGHGIVTLVLGYVLSIVAVYVLALIVNALAPTFGGAKNLAAAHKVSAYASTAGMVGGIFSLIPMLGILGLLASLYSIYLLYTGLPALMRNPQDKSIGYTVIAAICSIVVWVIISALIALFR